MQESAKAQLEVGLTRSDLSSLPVSGVAAKAGVLTVTVTTATDGKTRREHFFHHNIATGAHSKSLRVVGLFLTPLPRPSDAEARAEHPAPNCTAHGGCWGVDQRKNTLLGESRGG